MIILGINAYHGDAAAAIIKDGKLLAAVEEKRFNRVKHCAGFPIESVRYCLETAGVSIEAVDHIGISRDPSAHLHKKVLFAANRAAKSIGSRKQTAGGGAISDFGIRNSELPAAVEETPDLAPALLASYPQSEIRHSKSGSPQSEIRNPKSNGNTGVFRQIKDRLGNAAKVRDIKDVLARE